MYLSLNAENIDKKNGNNLFSYIVMFKGKYMKIVNWKNIKKNPYKI